MTVRTETVAYCSKCTWLPNPERRMSIDSQAAEHTTQQRHPTVTRTVVIRHEPITKT